MNVKSILAVPFAKRITKRIYAWAYNPYKTQDKVFKKLISKAKNTAFGKDHDFKNIRNYNDFKNNISISDYEDLRPYVDRVVAGEKDILWVGKPLYFAKTSGTTSGAKYIPITKDSMPTHIKAARNALLICAKLENKMNLKWQYISFHPFPMILNFVPPLDFQQASIQNQPGDVITMENYNGKL